MSKKKAAPPPVQALPEPPQVAVPRVYRGPAPAEPAAAWWTRGAAAFRRGFASASHQRLRSALATYRVELGHLAGLPARNGAADPVAPHWYEAALELLARADRAAAQGDDDLGWKCLFAVQRLELYGLAERRPDRLEARALAVLREAADKLTGWRREAVVGLLGDADGGAGAARVDALYEASLVLHEHYANEYAKLRDHKKLIAQLAVVAGLGVAGWLGLTLAWPGIFSVDVRAGGLSDPGLVLAVLLFGLLGACFSGLLRVFDASTGARIPRQLLGKLTTFGRLAAGVITALAAQLLLLSGLLPLRAGAVTPALLLVVAFASGFSERLVVRAVEGLAGERK